MKPVFCDVLRMVISAAIVFLASAHGIARADSGGCTAFLNVNVVPMDSERVLLAQTVVVRDGRISAVGPTATTEVPKDAVQIDARDRYLMPGLADMHAHTWNEEELTLFIANGVTVVRNMFGGPLHLEWRQRIAKGELLGPTIYTAGPIIDGDRPMWPGSQVVTTAEEARAVVAAQKDAGYDFLKVYNRLPLEAYDALVEAARGRGIPVAGHIPIPVRLPHALTARQRCVEHLLRYGPPVTADGSPPWQRLDPAKVTAVVRRTRNAGTWNCPTLVVYQKSAGARKVDAILARPEMKYVHPELLDSWRPENSYLKFFTPEMLDAIPAGHQARKKLTKALHDGGARILLGTDCMNPFVVHGFSLHEELHDFVDAGLTPYQAIKAGTHDGAEFFDALDEWGTVAVGRRADLILVEADPLEDVANVARRVGVMVRGRWLPQAELQTMLDALVDKYARMKAEASRPTSEPTDDTDGRNGGE